MSETKKLFLLDAMALIYRAYFALNRNPRINSKGLNTSAILGFTNTLYDVIKKEKPTHIGIAFDTHAPTVRHEDFTEYKANREAMPEDLRVAIPYIKQVIEAFNIPMLFVDGYEADDVIGLQNTSQKFLGAQAGDKVVKSAIFVAVGSKVTNDPMLLEIGEKSPEKINLHVRYIGRGMAGRQPFEDFPQLKDADHLFPGKFILGQ